jgi:uncharacterized membrane protein SirB2
VFEFAKWVASTPLNEAIQSRLWLTPLLQSVHILMIGIVFVSVLVVSLRVLGKMRSDEPFAEVWQRFAPWFWSSLGVMLATGLVLTAGEPLREVSAMSFWVKMTLLVVGVASAAYFGRTVAAASSAGTAEFSGGARFVAVATIVLWLAIIYFGRAIAYDVEVWGSWHLG